MMEPELYLIKLLRKAIHVPNSTEGTEDTEQSKTGSGVHSDEYDHGTSATIESADVFNTYIRTSANSADMQGNTSEEEPYLAMDYFDALIPKKIDITKDINEFMDIYASSSNRRSKYEVAMQSIPIYCLAEDIRKYEEKFSERTKDGADEENVSPYGNPFSEQDRYPYLSLVQIYIMPEIMARIESVKPKDGGCDDNSPNKVTRTVINQFYDDIHNIIDSYIGNHYKRDPFVFRVYRSMSAGDFTVAVSSNRPETAFILATLFRERGCYYSKSTNEDNTDKRSNSLDEIEKENRKTRYVFYKTYTLLSCNNSWSDSDQYEDDFKVDGRFVLRMTFSNKYWAEEARKNSKHPFDRLNGRYDFSVTLTEKEFRYLLKALYESKLGDESLFRLNKPDETEEQKRKEELEEEYSICKELIKYIANGYVAYVNERYIFKCKNMDIFPDDKESDQTRIRLSEETVKCRLLSENNEKAIKRVERRLDQVSAQVMFFDTNRRNMFYQLKLLRQMLSLCHTINGLSDTRIYCAILIRQIDVVLDGMEDSYQILKETRNRNFISITERALAEAVVSLDVYSKLIRDNNLQSLQTPNYNLESAVSMEKILVGYGELLNSLFKWYEGTKLCEEIYGLRQQYTPFMIPGNQEESLRTKVLFKEARPTFPNEKLMVVWCSNFGDLTNFGGTVGILFHEVAHNLRYRGRSDRNRIIMQYLTYLICDQITTSIIDNLQQNIPELRESVGLSRWICDSLYFTYNKVLYEDRDVMRLVKDFSYANVLDYIKNEYDKFSDVVRQINDIDRFIRQCISLRGKKNILERDEALKRVRILRSALVDNRSKTYGRRYFLRDDKEYNQKITEFMAQAVEALEIYLQAQEVNHDFDDVAAKLIYESLLANQNLDKDFEQMISRYGMVDRFFSIMGEELYANAKKLERTAENKVLVMEIGKVFQYLTHGSSDRDVEPSILEAYVSPHIIRTRMEAKGIIEQASVIYSEVCSDLFMYNLMEMTPFGYFSFLSEYAPSDARTSKTYVRRFCLVMYAAFGHIAERLKNKEEKRKYWRGLMERLYNDFVSMMDKSLEALFERCTEFDDVIIETKADVESRRKQPLSYWCEFIRSHITDYKDRYFQDNNENIKSFDKEFEYVCQKKDSKDIFKPLKHTGRKENDYFADDSPDDVKISLESILYKYERIYFLFMRGYIGSIYEEISESMHKSNLKCDQRGRLRELEDLQAEMSRFGYMSFFLRRLYMEIHQEITTLERLEYLAKDYQLGYENTRRLHDEFIVPGECWMQPYFEEIKELLNHPEHRYDTEIRKQTNTSMIRMISELYYRAIHGTAVEGITDSEV